MALTMTTGGGSVLEILDANGKVAPPAKTGTKRKTTEDFSDLDVENIDFEGMVIDASCNQVRGKIRRFLDSGEMTKGAFGDALGVSQKSLNDFLSRNGTMNGSGSASYGAAWEFFKKREIAGIKMPSNKKAKANAPASKSGSKKASATAPPDVSGISLSGEATDSVPVFESCDEIRKKINAHLVSTGMSQAAFCRELAAQMHTETRKIQSKQLVDFRSKKGPTDGNTSIVFYTAYVYFEKLRLAAGKPKSKHRKDMEIAHPPTGMDITRRDQGLFCFAGRVPVQNSLGQYEGF